MEAAGLSKFMSRIAFTVNQKIYFIEVDPETPLLWVLRDTLGTGLFARGVRGAAFLVEVGGVVVYGVREGMF